MNGILGEYFSNEEKNQNKLLLFVNCLFSLSFRRSKKFKSEVFPPNAGSKFQLIDYGVIKSSEAKHRKYLLKISTDRCEDSSIIVLDVMKISETKGRKKYISESKL